MMYTTTETITAPPITIGDAVITVTYTVTAFGGGTVKDRTVEGTWGQVEAVPQKVTVSRQEGGKTTVLEIAG